MGWKKHADSAPPSSHTNDDSYRGALKYRYALPLTGAGLQETSQTIHDMDQKFKNMFQLITMEGGTKKHYSFIAPTYEAKTSWMGDIDECIMQQLDIRKIRVGPLTENVLAQQPNLPTISGTLSVQNAETLTWKDRYVVIRNGMLSLFKDENDNALPKLTLQLFSCSVRLLRPSERDFTFQVLAPHQIYYLAAHSGEQLFDWIYTIRSTVERIMTLKDQQRAKNQLQHIPPALAQMLTDSENQHCADCEALDPQWANMTVGVFVCDVCYYIHKMCLPTLELRNLSRNKWTDEQAKRMLGRGNEVVNQELETEEIKKEKITPTSSYQAKVDFIRTKYNYPEAEAAPVELRSASSGSVARNLANRTGLKTGWLVLVDENDAKRYFYVLKKSSMYCYKSEKATGTPRGVIDIQTATTKPSEEDETIFEIITPSKIYTILCPSVVERTNWMEEITYAKAAKPSSSSRRDRTSRFLSRKGILLRQDSTP